MNALTTALWVNVIVGSGLGILLLRVSFQLGVYVHKVDTLEKTLSSLSEAFHEFKEHVMQWR